MKKTFLIAFLCLCFSAAVAVFVVNGRDAPKPLDARDFAEEEDWREWELLEPPRERAFLSGVRPRAQTAPVLAGEISEKTREIYERWGKGYVLGGRRCFYASGRDDAAEREAFAAVSGWRLPFADFCRSSPHRLRFAVFDIRLKAALADRLMRVPAGQKDSADAEDSDARRRMGAELFFDLLAEYRPGRAEALTREIEETPERFSDQARYVVLERARFDCLRQRELEKVFRVSGSLPCLFFGALESFFGNDLEAQRRFCAERGVFGKLEPSNFDRPDLSLAAANDGEASSRAAALEPPRERRLFVSGDVPLTLKKEDDAALGFSAGTRRAREIFGRNWDPAAARLLRPRPRPDLTKRESFDRWRAAAEAALPLVSGWKISFDDARLQNFCDRFSVGDLLLKRNLALGLTDVRAHRGFTDFGTAREHWRMGARLFGEILAEYQPGLEEKLKAEIDAAPPEAPSFPPKAKDTPLARACFAYARQKKIREFLEQTEPPVDLTGRFLAGLETFYGNDIDAQLKICSETGVRGKIDLTRLRRPALSDEAILQYEERVRLKK